MLRIIDMSSVNDTPGAFAVWDTVTDSFLTDSAGEQCWDSMHDIDGLDRFMLRIGQLVPMTATEVARRPINRETTHTQDTVGFLSRAVTRMLNDA